MRNEVLRYWYCLLIPFLDQTYRKHTALFFFGLLNEERTRKEWMKMTSQIEHLKSVCTSVCPFGTSYRPVQPVHALHSYKRGNRRGRVSRNAYKFTQLPPKLLPSFHPFSTPSSFDYLSFCLLWFHNLLAVAISSAPLGDLCHCGSSFLLPLLLLLLFLFDH